MAERVTPGDWAAYDQMRGMDNPQTRAFAGVDYFNDANQAQAYANARSSMLSGLLGNGAAAAATQPNSQWADQWGGQPAAAPAPTRGFDWGSTDYWGGTVTQAPAPRAYNSEIDPQWGGPESFQTGGSFGQPPAGAPPPDFFSPNATPGAPGFGDRIMSPHGFNTPWGAPNYVDVPTPQARPFDMPSTPGSTPDPTGVNWGGVMGSFDQMDSLVAQTMQPGYFDQAPSPGYSTPAAAPASAPAAAPAAAPASTPAADPFAGGYTSGYYVDPLTAQGFNNGVPVSSGWGNFGGLLGWGGDSGGAASSGGGFGGGAASTGDFGAPAGGGWGNDTYR